MNTPKRYPVYTVDDGGNIREYCGPDAWNCLRNRSRERRVFKKDLPKGFKVSRSYTDFDV